MRKIVRFSITAISLFLLLSPSAFPAWVWSPEAGKFINPDAVVQGTPQEQYDYAMGYYKKKNLKEAAEQLRRLLKKYPGAQIAPEGQYRLGVVYEEMGDFYRAFRAYRDLLQRYPQNEHMSEVIEREFRIGNLFLSGRRAKIMGLGILPSGPRAIEVFKHVVDTAPYSEYGDRAQFHLGLAYKKTNQFEEAIEAFQGVIDRYPQSKLVPQARYQMADTSYLQSVAATRDQRAIDRAAQEIDEFLKYHPDSSVSDKAARLRQEIDEKNAEKNYRIGVFYEKENYLESAFIYYRDVAARYPQTQWGPKATERLQALEKPAEFLKAQEAEALSKKQKIESELVALGDSDPARKKELQWELERAKKGVKEVKKSKPETLKRRRAALRQKEKELQEKWKVLKKKKKRFAKNPSEDLVVAFTRWEGLLEREKADLAKEKLRIEDWGKNLGVDITPFYAHLVPFGKGAPTPLEQVRQVEAKRFAELAKEKAGLLRKKEDVYREYEKWVALEGLSGEEDATLQADRQKLEQKAEEIGYLAKTLQEKEKRYEKHFGTSPWQAVWQVSTKVVVKSVSVLNPFEVISRKDWESKSADELKTLESHWKEKVSAQKTLVDTIAQAFDDELARAEEKRLIASVEEKATDPAALRRSIKQLEREIRSRYNEIQDRNARKNELLEDLEGIFKHKGESGGSLAKSGKIVAAPVTGFYKFGKAFLFGLPQRDVKLTQEAKQFSGGEVDSETVARLRKEIELESLLIQARNQEIQKLEGALEALRARASLSETPAGRSLLIKFPYVFVREAIVNAGRLVPKEGRQDKLIEQLNQETAKLEQLKKELKQIESILAKKSKSGSPEPVVSEPPAPEKNPDQAQLQEGVRSLQKQLEFQEKNYEYELERFEKVRWQKLSKAHGKGRTEKVKKIEENLVRLIGKEQKIHQEEKELLTKKEEVLQQFWDQSPSDLYTKELNLEKEEIESRLNEIQKRQTTLGEELKRFQ